jgi:hypothetical protein
LDEFTAESYQNFKNNKLLKSWVPVPHACNRCYSGDRDQKDCGSKPAQAKSSRDPVEIGFYEKPFTKIGLVEWLKVKALSSSPSTAKTKQTNKQKNSSNNSIK